MLLKVFVEGSSRVEHFYIRHDPSVLPWWTTVHESIIECPCDLCPEKADIAVGPVSSENDYKNLDERLRKLRKMKVIGLLHGSALARFLG